MTSAARRRLRVAAVFGIVVIGTDPVILPALGLGSLGPTVIVAVTIIATSIAAIRWSRGVSLRGLWGLACSALVVYAMGFVALAVAYGPNAVLWFLALALASLGVVGTAWIRVAWWVGAAMSVALLVLNVAVAVTEGGHGEVVAWQAENLAVTLGVATVGSWFLEAAERRSFAQGLLIDRLFRSYLSPDVAEVLVEDPARAELGGELVDVSVLFADLRGYTPFSEGRSPAEVVAMLNAAFGAAVPAVFAEGGTIVSFVGDALMAIWNAPLRQPDHALRACRAALALQSAALEAGLPGAPRFRVGINTGSALVGNIGAAELRNFSALGDTTNTAARLQTYAPEGAVVIGERTYEVVRNQAEVRALGPAELKGKSAPIPVYELLGLGDAASPVDPEVASTGSTACPG